MELIRKLLFAVESGPGYLVAEDLNLEGYTKDQLNYHAGLLVEARLAEGQGICEAGKPIPKYDLYKLTWNGHEFLDAARDDKRWRTAMAKVVEMGGTVTIGVLQQILVAVMKGTVGLP